MFEQAKEKIERELKSGKFDRYGEIMKKGTSEALITLCQQNKEFAQAVALGGSFEDCMKAVAKNCGNGISDFEAYRRAAQFYFPGIEIIFQMKLIMCADEADIPSKASEVIIDLADFFS